MSVLQELFDKIATHLLTQGARSENSLGKCLYRGEFGRKCAVGCLISDEEYEQFAVSGGTINLRPQVARRGFTHLVVSAATLRRTRDANHALQGRQARVPRSGRHHPASCDDSSHRGR